MSAVPVPTEEWRASLAAGRRALREAYQRKPSPARLLRDHARLIDRTLRGLWQAMQPARQAALVATGGYGRGELFPSSDIVILILPYTPQTHYFIGAAELAKMKPSAVLINIARGSIVDDTALARALKARQIWAAGLDVYENEPEVNPALFELDNVVLSPHIASATEPTRQAMAMLAARNCVTALTTADPPPNLLNPEARRKS